MKFTQFQKKNIRISFIKKWKTLIFLDTSIYYQRFNIWEINIPTNHEVNEKSKRYWYFHIKYVLMHLFYGQREFLIIIEFSHRWHENVGGRYQLESRDRVVRKSSSWWSIITGDSWPINSVFALSWQMEQKSEHVGFKVSRCNRNRIEFAVFTLPLNLCVHPPCRCSSFRRKFHRE